MTQQSQELELGTILRTKDGRNIGNAIVVGQTKVWNLDKSVLKREYYTLETDFGNEANLSLSEIHDWFHVSMMVRDIDKWRKDRDELIALRKAREECKT